MGFNPWNLPNQNNRALQDQASAWAKLLNGGKVRSSFLDLNFANFGDTVQQPFRVSGSSPPNNTPAPGNPGVENTIMEYQVAPGMCAIITGLFHGYDPGGQANNWTQGDGQLVFFLSVDNCYVPNFVNMFTGLGTPQVPYDISRGIPVQSGQIIRYTFNTNATTLIISDPAVVIAGVSGVTMPIR